MVFPLFALFGASAASALTTTAVAGAASAVVGAVAATAAVNHLSKSSAGKDAATSSKKNLLDNVSREDIIRANEQGSTDASLLKQKAERLQSILKHVRYLSGIKTQEELGNMLAISKQAISNLENGSSKLTVAQYIAISSILFQRSFMSEPRDNLIPSVLYHMVETANQKSEQDLLKLRLALKKIADAKQSLDNLKSTEGLEMREELVRDLERSIEVLVEQLIASMNNPDKP